MRIITRALTVLLISGLVGCSTKESLIPIPDKDMRQVYDLHMNGAGTAGTFDSRSVLRRPMDEGDVQLSEYVRVEKNYLESKFKTIPNPTMFMFVAPHLSTGSEVPIPGYLTEFKMWKTEHYALPGEISDMEPSFGEMK